MFPTIRIVGRIVRVYFKNNTSETEKHQKKIYVSAYLQ